MLVANQVLDAAVAAVQDRTADHTAERAEAVGEEGEGRLVELAEGGNEAGVAAFREGRIEAAEAVHSFDREEGHSTEEGDKDLAQQKPEEAASLYFPFQDAVVASMDSAGLTEDGNRNLDPEPQSLRLVSVERDTGLEGDLGVGPPSRLRGAGCT